VEQESTHEFLASETCGFSESGFEADVSVADVEQTMVGDAHAVGVVAEIGVDLGWTGEGTLGVDDPFFAVERVDQELEGLRVGQMSEGPIGAELPLRVDAFHSGEQLAAKQSRQGFDREEKATAPEGEPFSVQCEASSGNDRV